MRIHTFDLRAGHVIDNVSFKAQGFGVTPLIFSAQRDLSGKLAAKSRGQ
jgi:hypothetical protein